MARLSLQPWNHLLGAWLSHLILVWGKSGHHNSTGQSGDWHAGNGVSLCYMRTPCKSSLSTSTLVITVCFWFCFCFLVVDTCVCVLSHFLFWTQMARSKTPRKMSKDSAKRLFSEGNFWPLKMSYIWMHDKEGKETFSTGKFSATEQNTRSLKDKHFFS